VLADTADQPSTRAAGSKWTDREAELLTVTLELLRQHGFDRLTVEAVAARAKASKATMYRRWPSKADLVLAAVTEGTRSVTVPPHTGSLRGDLLEFGWAVCRQSCEHASTMRAVLNEMSHNPQLRAAMQSEFVHQRKQVIDEILAEAVERGQIQATAINNDIDDLLPGYLVFRSVVSGRQPTQETVRTLVDDVLLPSLTAGLRTGR
jgi:AcrR family transcriptional regulator